MTRPRLDLAAYIERRNGVPTGASGSLRNMLDRSFGAPTFAGFWRHWNPIFGYYLGTYTFTPLRRILPRGPALIGTFVVCGALHDAVTMVIRGAVTFFFTPWFLFLGLGVVAGSALGWNLAERSWIVRAATNASYLGAALALTLITRRLLAIP